jgi:beta-phosphoglucomutase-like phosphatase (HAD superfamily)
MVDLIQNNDLFIFDLDDTIVKTEKFHYEAWLTTLKNFISKDFTITYDFFCSKFHATIKNNNSIKEYLVNELELINYEEIINFKNDKYISIINKNKINLIEGCDKLMNLIINNKKQFVIVTNSLKCQIDYFSELFPILKKSSKNYYREIIKLKKPNPECYKMVLNDFPNKQMVAFEDSITGIQAITQIPEIYTYFINSIDYIHFEYIINNYRVTHINNYLDLL